MMRFSCRHFRRTEDADVRKDRRLRCKSGASLIVARPYHVRSCKVSGALRPTLWHDSEYAFASAPRAATPGVIICAISLYCAWLTGRYDGFLFMAISFGCFQEAEATTLCHLFWSALAASPFSLSVFHFRLYLGMIEVLSVLFLTVRNDDYKNATRLISTRDIVTSFEKSCLSQLLPPLKPDND